MPFPCLEEVAADLDSSVSATVSAAAASDVQRLATGVLHAGANKILQSAGQLWRAFTSTHAVCWPIMGQEQLYGKVLQKLCLCAESWQAAM